MQANDETLIKTGDRFKVTNHFDVHGDAILTVTKVERPESRDGIVYYRTDKLIGRRRNHKGKVWWFNEFCIKV